MQHAHSSTLTDYLEKKEVFPMLGLQFAADAYCRLSLDRSNALLSRYPTHTYSGLEALIEDHLLANQASVAMGGYGEHRTLYDASPHFDGTRCIHLGLDLWAPAGTQVYAPLAGRVHSLRFNAGMLDYGATIILEHEWPGGTFFSLYGHIDQASLERWKPGELVAQGQAFCAFGPREENGGWVPHLHFQLIQDLEGKQGDYPGVCTLAEKARYLANCPDPELLFRKPEP